MDGTYSAHGLGGAKDLPVPAELATVGAVAALLISFTVLALAWRRPRFETRTPHRPVPRVEAFVSSTPFRVVARGFGLVALLYCVVAAVLGKDLVLNPVFGITYVFMWVGIVPASLALGPVWRAISPFRTITQLLHRLAGTDVEHGMFTYPTKLGLWPAALGLYLFVWMELDVAGVGLELGALRFFLTVYLVVMVLGGAFFGTRFLESADPFEVYSSLLAKLSPWGRSADGRLVLMSPLRNLASTPPRAGLVAVVAVLFGTTAYDSFHESPQWVRFVQGSDVSGTVLNNLAMLSFCVLAWLVFTLATMTTGVEKGVPRRALPALFAHAMVPIVVGYVFAHYFTYLVFMGQDTLIKMSDPLSRGDDLLGTGDWRINNWLGYQPTLVACLKVVGVVVGHVLGAVASHDRALRLLPARHHVTGQLTLLTAMVLFTAGGLYLLFAA